MGISRLFYKDTHLALMKRGEQFVLTLSYADQPATRDEILWRWPEVEVIEPYFQGEDASEADIPFNKLGDLLNTLTDLEAKCARIKKLVFYIQPEVRRVRIQNAPPPEFCLTYKWADGKLSRSYPASVVELPGGWYRLGDVYWRFPTLSAIDQERIRRTTIEKHELLEFLQRDLSAYAGAGVRYACGLHFDTIQALELVIESIESGQVQIRMKWNAPPEHIDRDFDLAGYVIAGRTLRPGIRPDVLASHLKFDGEVATLKGIEIARFLDEHYQAVKPWITGGVKLFEAAHSFLKPPYEWILVAGAEPAHGVGRAFAQPVALIGGEEFPTSELVQMMQVPYAHLQRGWVRRVDLLTLGIDTKVKWNGKGNLKPVRLTPAQIVFRGDAKLTGPWTRMELRGALWCASPVKQRAAREHLEFLTYWGVPGGITGGYEAAAIYGVELLNSLLARDAKAKVLVVGEKADLEEFKAQSGAYQALNVSQYEENRENTIYFAPFDRLSGAQAIAGATWDVLLLIEPDILYTPGRKAALENITAVNAACRIGFYVTGPSVWGNDAQFIHKAALGMGAMDNALPYLIQIPRALTPLPPPFVFSPSSVTPTTDSGYDYVVPGEAPKGSPIPPRTQSVQPSIPVSPPAAIQPVSASVKPTIMTGNTSAEGFIREARKFASLGGAAQAERVPFSCYWPKYSDMNVPQRNWYFHLRSRMRRGDYPDTDLSYLFVRIYELINGIACENATSAYHELMAIWRHYRDRYPKLDKYLDDWAFDFVCLKNPGVSAWEHMKAAPALTQAALDTALTQRIVDEPLVLPLPALELISGYRITQSKFWLSGHGELMANALPLAIAFADAHIRESEHGGLLGRFAPVPVREKRNAFQSAVVEREMQYELTYVPYCASEPLKELISQMLRYVENALRARCGFEAKLRGVALDKPYSDWIDAYIARQFAPKKAVQVQPASRVSLDASTLEKLRSESDEVRDALIASMEQEEPEAACDVRTPARPADAPEGMLTDLDPVNRILHALTEDQRLILEHFRAKGWELDAGACARAFPALLMDAELDDVNAQSLRYLGAQLIAREETLFAVADDYRDELEYLIENPMEHKPSAWAVDEEGLDPEWIDFFRAADLDSLGAVLSGNGELQHLASGRGEMPDLLLDAVNAAAMETVGDLVVDGEAISEEYMPLIAGHLRRA